MIVAFGFSVAENMVVAGPAITARSVEGVRVVSEGWLSGGLPYLRLGPGTATGDGGGRSC